jgi:serine/threonine-protein kinase RsbW/stage II sporulation protein AB (anti-sigma F factor)
VTEIQVPARPPSVPKLRRELVSAARMLGVPPELCARIALAVSEAATNAVIHAFPSRPGCLSARLARDGEGGIDIVVGDDGIGLTLRSDSPGLGMGLGIIAQVTDRLEIRSQPSGGTQVEMGFTPRHPRGTAPEHR